MKHDTLVQVKTQLATEKTPKHQQTTFIGKTKTQRLIRLNYQQALQKNKLTQAPATVKRRIHQQVSQAVTTQVTQDNRALTPVVATIRREIKKQLTQAFLRPYRLALPFTFGMLLTVFLFRKRQDYLNRN